MTGAAMDIPPAGADVPHDALLVSCVNEATAVAPETAATNNSKPCAGDPDVTLGEVLEPNVAPDEAPSEVFPCKPDTQNTSMVEVTALALRANDIVLVLTSAVVTGAV
jgi:hypothetical protein